MQIKFIGTCGTVLMYALLSGCSAKPLQEAPAILPESTAMSAAMQNETTSAISTQTTALTGVLQTPEEICLTDSEGNGKNYTFVYNGETFEAVYTPDHWKIIDSYRITNTTDILLICTALRDEHPVHGADMTSYREASDMAYEWAQHNLAFQLLSDSSPLKEHAKDVDLDPNDQGKSMYEIFTDRQNRDQPDPDHEVRPEVA